MDTNDPIPPCFHCIEWMKGSYVCGDKGCAHYTNTFPVLAFKRNIKAVKLGMIADVVLMKFKSNRSKVIDHGIVPTSFYEDLFNVEMKIPSRIVEWRYRHHSFLFMLMPIQMPDAKSPGFAYSVVLMAPKETRDKEIKLFIGNSTNES